MTSITATAARKDIYNLIARVNEDCKPIAITSSRGKGAVLVGEDDWAAIEETLYIMGIPGMAEINGVTASSKPTDLISAAKVSRKQRTVTPRNGASKSLVIGKARRFHLPRGRATFRAQDPREARSLRSRRA